MKALAPLFVILAIAALVLVVVLIKRLPRTKKNLFLILGAFLVLFLVLAFAVTAICTPV